MAVQISIKGSEKEIAELALSEFGSDIDAETANREFARRFGEWKGTRGMAKIEVTDEQLEVARNSGGRKYLVRKELICANIKLWAGDPKSREGVRLAITNLIDDGMEKWAN